MPQQNLFAYTAATAQYPAYVSINQQENGDVIVTLRADADIRDGVFICSHTGGAGRCTAGGPNCNNYCNMAPEKGPMQDRPLPCRHVAPGQTVQVTIAAADWKGFTPATGGDIKR